MGDKESCNQMQGPQPGLHFAELLFLAEALRGAPGREKGNRSNRLSSCAWRAGPLLYMFCFNEAAGGLLISG